MISRNSFLIVIRHFNQITFVIPFDQYWCDFESSLHFSSFNIHVIYILSNTSSVLWFLDVFWVKIRRDYLLNIFTVAPIRGFFEEYITEWWWIVCDLALVINYTHYRGRFKFCWTDRSYKDILVIWRKTSPLKLKLKRKDIPISILPEK